MNKVLSLDEYRFRLKECDGLCSLCNEWAIAKVDPNQEMAYCPECENRSVYGINVARQKGFVAVLNDKRV